MDAVNKFKRVRRIIEDYKCSESKLIPILHAVQKEYRYLPREIMSYIAASLNIPASRVYGVATFYSNFALEPKGKYVIKVCDGTACHVKGSARIEEVIRKRLGLKKNQTTTSDMLFTLETVSCLGACGLAPAVVVNEEVHGLMTEESTIQMLENLIFLESAGESNE
jgi:NADH-quinone oxidoreductase subunit E